MGKSMCVSVPFVEPAIKGDCSHSAVIPHESEPAGRRTVFLSERSGDVAYISEPIESGKQFATIVRHVTHLGRRFELLHSKQLLTVGHTRAKS